MISFANPSLVMSAKTETVPSVTMVIVACKYEIF